MAHGHNAFGEHGERLTILSLLPRTGPDPGAGTGSPAGANAGAGFEGGPAGMVAPAVEGDDHLSLGEAVRRLYRMAGEDGRAGVVLSVATAADGSTSFDAAEDVALKDVADGLYEAFGDGGRCLVTLSVVGPDDDPLAPVVDIVSGGGTEGGAGGPPAAGRRSVDALRRLRERVHRLFGAQGSDGTPPTVLSLLVSTSEDPDE